MAAIHSAYKFLNPQTKFYKTKPLKYIDRDTIYIEN